ncbi:MAG: hypothetical protein ACP5GX_03105 [Anaerolineae bacterium]
MRGGEARPTLVVGLSHRREADLVGVLQGVGAVDLVAPLPRPDENRADRCVQDVHTSLT